MDTHIELNEATFKFIQVDDNICALTEKGLVLNDKLVENNAFESIGQWRCTITAVNKNLILVSDKGDLFKVDVSNPVKSEMPYFSVAKDEDIKFVNVINTWGDDEYNPCFNVLVTQYNNEVILLNHSYKSTKILKPSKDAIDNVWVGEQKDGQPPCVYIQRRGLNEVFLQKITLDKSLL